MARELIVQYTRKDFRQDTFCTGGPGGQNQNRKRNGVRFTHIETGLSAESRTYKRYEQNRKAAFEKLGRLLQAHWREQLAVERVRATETVRTYHEPDNRVKDHASGLQSTWTEVVDGRHLDEMIRSRHES